MGPRTWRIGPAGLVIGRGPESDVILGEASVSRRHAVLQITRAGTVSIEDPGSRHGTRVNGTRITGVAQLKHGDRVAISEHQFVLFETARLGRERAPTEKLVAVSAITSQTAAVRPPRPSEVTGEIDPGALMLSAVEDALAKGDTVTAERDLEQLLDVVETAERAGGADAAQVRRFAACALRAAATLGRGDWIDTVVELHTIRPRVMHAATIDAFEGALERISGIDRTKFVQYVHEIRARERGLGTYERFCLERLLKLAVPR